MKNKLLIIMIILFTLIFNVGFISAENTTAEIKNEDTEEDRIGEKVKSEDEGYLNIRFNDSYNGYCINKGLSGAKVNDTFEVQETCNALSNRDKSQIGNYIKQFFVDNHDTVTTDYKTTQNIIWTFSNFDYKNSDSAIIQNILNNPREIKDHGTAVKINDTTEAIFDFELLKTSNMKNQNFFGYKITYRNIEYALNETLNASNTLPEDEIQESFNEPYKSVSENTSDVKNSSLKRNYAFEKINDKTENTTAEKPAAHEKSVNDKENVTVLSEKTISKACGNPLAILMIALISVAFLRVRKIR